MLGQKDREPRHVISIHPHAVEDMSAMQSHCKQLKCHNCKVNSNYQWQEAFNCHQPKRKISSSVIKCLRCTQVWCHHQPGWSVFLGHVNSRHSWLDWWLHLISRCDFGKHRFVFICFNQSTLDLWILFYSLSCEKLMPAFRQLGFEPRAREDLHQSFEVSVIIISPEERADVLFQHINDRPSAQSGGLNVIEHITDCV